MSESFFDTASPYFLLLWILVPLIYRWRRQGRGKPVMVFSSNTLFEGVPTGVKERFLFVPPLLRCLAFILLVFALARPQAGNKITETISEGVDIILAVDTSGSMKALDFRSAGKESNRLDAIKDVVADFVDKRPYDRIGMVVFGERAFTQCPLTLDHDTIDSLLEWVTIGMAGDGTAIGNGLALSVKRLKDRPTKSKIVILLTDGRNTAGEVAPLMAAEMASQYGIKVYTIGVGSRGLVPYPQETPYGTRIVYAQVDLDEDLMREIAQKTGGAYFRATETEELEEIYATIDEMEKTEVEIKEYKEVNELFPSFVAGGIILLLLELFLSQTFFRRLP